MAEQLRRPTEEEVREAVRAGEALQAMLARCARACAEELERRADALIEAAERLRAWR